MSNKDNTNLRKTEMGLKMTQMCPCSNDYISMQAVQFIICYMHWMMG